MRRTSGKRYGGALALAAWLLVAACALHGPPHSAPEPPEPAVRIWLPAVVWWTGARRELSLAVENGTDHTVRVEAPAARRVRATLFLGPGPDRACGVVPDEGEEEPPGPPVTLAPGEVASVTVDLAGACGRLPPGEYRYEVGYEAPSVASGPPLKTRPQHGHVVVEAGAGGQGPDRGSLGSSGATRSR